MVAKIVIDRESCIGCGTCVALAPETFELDEEGKAKVKNGQDSPEDIQNAIESCPTKVIKYEG